MSARKLEVNFSGSVIEVTVTDKASQVDEWVSSVRLKYAGEAMIVGLDCEWKPHMISSMSNNTATMQLCIGTKCLIIQMFYIDYLPQLIKSFLSDPSIMFVGVEVGDDAQKLRDEYGLVVTKTSPLRFYRKPGLKNLAFGVVGILMPKPKHVCRSNWENRVLTDEQVEYGAIDTYASYRICMNVLREI